MVKKALVLYNLPYPQKVIKPSQLMSKSYHLKTLNPSAGNSLRIEFFGTQRVSSRDLVRIIVPWGCAVINISKAADAGVNRQFVRSFTEIGGY